MPGRLRSRISRSKSSSLASASALIPSPTIVDREAARPQALLQERGQPRLVLGDQDPAHRWRGRGCSRDDDREGRAQPGSRVELDRAAVRLGDRAHDREPEPGAVGGLRGVVAARVASEDPLAVGVVDPGPFVADPEPGPVADQRAAEPDRLALAGVADGVLGQVHDRLGEPLLVGDDDPDPGAVEAPVAIAEAAGLGEQVVREQVEVDRAGAQEVRAAAPWPAGAGRRRSGSSGRARPGSPRSPPRAPRASRRASRGGRGSP